jgi:hypothetical protein
MPSLSESKQTIPLTLTQKERLVLPAPIVEVLESPAAQGGRHDQVNYLLPSLIGNGFSTERVYEILRPLYDEDFSDDEINSLIEWHASKGYKPTVFKGGPRHPVSPNAPPPRRSVAAKPKETPEEKRRRLAEEALFNARAFLGGFWCNVIQVITRSPLTIPRTPKGQALVYLSCVHPSEERWVNVVTEFTLDDQGKANPVGAGETYPVPVLRKRIGVRGVMQSCAGGWIRHNSVLPARVEGGKPFGSGKEGAWTDADVAACDRLLVESDILPLGVQLAVLVRLELPLLCLLDSGGRSIQAIVKTLGLEESQRILGLLKPLGFDQSNDNPGRLSRLPGALRKIKARNPKKGDLQRLIYACPDPTGRPILP